MMIAWSALLAIVFIYDYFPNGSFNGGKGLILVSLTLRIGLQYYVLIIDLWI